MKGRIRTFHGGALVLLLSGAVLGRSGPGDLLGNAEDWETRASARAHGISIRPAASPPGGLTVQYSLSCATEESWVSAFRRFPRTRDFSEDEGFRLRLIGDGSGAGLHVDLAGKDESDFLRWTAPVDWRGPHGLWLGQEAFATYGATTLSRIHAIRLSLDANGRQPGPEGTITVAEWSVSRRPKDHPRTAGIEFEVIGHDPIERNYLYVTDRSMRPVQCRHQYLTDSRLRVLPASEEPVFLHLLWKAPALGTVMAYADNGGKGFTCGPRSHCLSLSLAETKVRRLAEKFEAWSADGYKFSEDLIKRVAGVREAWERVRSLETIEKADLAAESDRIMGVAGRALEDIEIERARADIDRFGRRDMEVILQSRSGRATGGYTVSVRQSRREFLMGAHPLQEVLGAMENSEHIRETAPATFNLGIVPAHTLLFTEPREATAALERTWQRSQELLSKHRELGFEPQGSVCPWFTRKAGLWSGLLPFDTMCARLAGAVGDTVRCFRDSVNIWLVINEAHDWANAPGFSHTQLVEVTRAVVDAAHGGNPESRTIVNACLPWGIYLHWREDDSQWTPYDYFEALNRAGVRYDIIGLQLYTGFDPTFPLRDLADMSALLDRYAAFGKPIHITEMCSPSSASPYGSWHGESWNEERQADYVAGLYTIAHGKPFVEALRWFSFSDRQFKLETGLVDRDLARAKPSYERLADLAQSWTTNVEGTTSDDGCFRFRGYLGDYMLTVAQAQMPSVTRTARLSPGAGCQRVIIQVD